MPLPRKGIPKYCHHKGSGQAYVKVQGNRVYLGVYGSAGSKERYERFVRQWRREHEAPEQQLRPGLEYDVEDLIDSFRTFALEHYRRPDGSLTEEPAKFDLSVRELLALCPTRRANEFRPSDLKWVRKAMIEAGLSKNVINQRIGRIRRIWRWGVSEEVVEPAVLLALEAVTDLQQGRGDVRETEEVGPVEWSTVEATLPFLTSDQLRAMVLIQWHAGMRPGEVCVLRSGDIYREGWVQLGMRQRITLPAGSWAYVVRAKMAHVRRQKQQVYALGPRARAVLAPWLRDDPDEYLFQPREAAEARRARLRAERKSKVPPSQRDRRKRSPKKRPGERYTTDSYGSAVASAALKANTARACTACKVLEPGQRCASCAAQAIPHWHPHQLRHAVEARIEPTEGIEGGRKVLGHRHVDTTKLYGSRDILGAAEIMERLG